MPAFATEPDDSNGLEAAIDQVIADCGGDPQAAVRALIVANGFLEQEAERMRAVISRGYVRGFYARLAHSETMASGHSGER